MLLRNILVISLVIVMVVNMSAYENFKTAIYCPVHVVQEMYENDDLEKKYELLSKYINIDKVYLETFRNGNLIEEEKIQEVAKYFQNKGVKTSGGITPTGDIPIAGHMAQLCYTKEKHKKLLKKVVELTARNFDEVILDDFYFTNCKCEACIKAKGSMSWSEYRLELMKDITKNIVLKTAREVNPDVEVIVKYPNWYEEFRFTGYNLKAESELFDKIYTGTETRDPVYTHQNLQPYQSYSIMRYFENVKPGDNEGGWVDEYSRRTLDRYAEQLELTLFAKAKEITLFNFNSILEEVKCEQGTKFISHAAPVAEYVFEKADCFLDELGEPVGITAYKPANASGEKYIHSYLGMLGIPVELTPEFPQDSKTVLLAESAKYDDDILAKIKDFLAKGGNLYITSGFLKAMQDKGLNEIIQADYTDKKVAVNQFSGMRFVDIYNSSSEIIIPRIDYPNNDTWKEILAIGNGNSFPILLKSNYSKGLVHILTIPDDFSELYKLPRETLTRIKEFMLDDFELLVDAPPRVAVFQYDNDTFIVQSFLSHSTDIKMKLDTKEIELESLTSGRVLTGYTKENKTVFTTRLSPNSYKVFKINK